MANLSLKRRQPNYLGFNSLVSCILLGVLVLWLSLFPFWSTPSRSVPPVASVKEVRGVWLTNVSSGVLFMPWGIHRAIRQLSQLHFNTLYPVVWNRGYTFYPSQVAERISGQSQQPFLSLMHLGGDVLEETIDIAHRQGLRVIPWFEYGSIVPANSSLAKRYPNWLSRNRSGSSFITSTRTDLDLLPPSQSKLPRQSLKQQVWLNLFHPEVQKFIRSLILEVVTHYEVDGIQLDDHFGLPVEFGYDYWTVQLYKKEHRGHSPPKDIYNPEWMRWRAAKLTAFMSQIVRAVRQANPDVKISLSPNSYAFSYRNYLQDWKTWVERGLIDELVLQVYRSDSKSFQAELSQPAVQLARSRIPVSIGIITGTLNRPVKVQQIQQQVNLVRQWGFKGVSFFYWESLWGYLTPESPRKRRQVFQSLFVQSVKAGTKK